jgi:molybdenum cofactor cytidylyltransferase
MKFHEAFRVVKGDIVSFVGAGGKTSTLIRLSRELHQLGWRVLATTTTRIAESELAQFPHAIQHSEVQPFDDAMTQTGCLFAYSEIRGGKAYGFTPDSIASLRATVTPDVILIEADGARRKLLKAPYPHEPVIPPETTLVVPIVSLASIGCPLDEASVYNAEAIAARVGARLGDPVQPEWLAAVIRDRELGLKGVPTSARAVAFINQASADDLERAGRIAQLALISGSLQAVAIGSAQEDDPVFQLLQV